MQPDEIRHYNNEIVYMLSRFLSDAPRAIDIRDVRHIANSCRVSPDYAYASLLAGLIGLETEGRDRDFFRNYFIPMVHALDADRFRKNSYYRHISIKESESGYVRLTHQEIAPAEGFICGDFTVKADGRLIPSLGFFDSAFSYPAVLEKGREWMTLMPNETITTDPCAKAASGHVLTFGLGLGYFIYRALENPAVADVTVVELSADVIRLFEREILPQFPKRDRVKIVQDDAFAFIADSSKMKPFDYIFADIWHDVGDGKPLYLKFKTFEEQYPGKTFAYWIEDSIKCYLDPSLWPAG